MDKPSLQECYKTLQDNCNIKVGDQVKVLRKAKTHEMGWDNIWNSDMDEAVGNVYEVTYLRPFAGIGLHLSYSLSFPFFVLEKIEIEEDVLEVTMQEVEDKFGCKVKIIRGEDYEC